MATSQAMKKQYARVTFFASVSFLAPPVGRYGTTSPSIRNMSSFNVIALAIAAVTATSAVSVWIQGKAGVAAREVHTGVVHGLAVSNRTRRMWLYQMFVSMQTTNFALNLAVGLGMYRVAQATVSPEAASVAYVVAFIFFVGSFMVASWSLVTVSGLLKSIRQAERLAAQGR